MVLSLGQAPQPLSICHSFSKVTSRRLLLDWQPSPEQTFFRVQRNNSSSMHSDHYIESLIFTPIKHFLIKGIYCMGLPTKKKKKCHLSPCPMGINLLATALTDLQGGDQE